jgi:DNA recombination protein RmuC
MGTFITGAVFGALVGAAVTWLLAVRRGGVAGAGMSELVELQSTLAEAVRRSGAEVLADSVKQLSAAAAAHVREQQAAAHGDLRSERQQLAALVQPLKDDLGRVDEHISALQRHGAAAQGALTSQLDALRQAQGELLQGTRSLVGALRRPHVRGRWGEITLRNVIEAAGLLAYVDFVEQPQVPTDDGGVLRPDAIVRLPAGRRIVIDAKFPLEAYLDAIAATEDDERQRHLVNHAAQVKTHIRALDGKRYWQQFTDSPDFVVLFVPNDAVLSAALDVDRELVRTLHRHRIVLATPLSLLALLRTLAFGWREERVGKDVQVIQQLGRQLHERLATVTEKLVLVGRRIEATTGAYNDLTASWDTRLLPAAKKLDRLGAGSDKALPEDVRRAEREVRQPVERAA